MSFAFDLIKKRRNIDKTNYLLIEIFRDDRDPSLGMERFLEKMVGVRNDPVKIKFDPWKFRTFITKKESPETTFDVVKAMDANKSKKHIFLVGHWSQYKLLNTDAIVETAKLNKQELHIFSCGCKETFEKNPDVIKFCANGIITGGYDGKSWGLFEFNFDSGMYDFTWGKVLGCLVPNKCYQTEVAYSAVETDLKNCFEEAVVMHRDKVTPSKSFFHILDKSMKWSTKEFLANPKDDKLFDIEKFGYPYDKFKENDKNVCDLNDNAPKQKSNGKEI
jgi:hypothetical protein